MGGKVIVYCDAKECVCCKDGICQRDTLRLYDGSCGFYEPNEGWYFDAQAENAGKAATDL